MLQTLRQMKGRSDLSLPHKDKDKDVSSSLQISISRTDLSPEKGSDDRSIATPSIPSPSSSPLYVYRLDEDDQWLDRELSTIDDASASVSASVSASASRSIRLCVYHVRRSKTKSERSVDFDRFPGVPRRETPYTDFGTLPFVQFMMAPPPAPVDVGTVGAAFAPKTAGWMVVDETMMVSSTDTEQSQTRAANACIEHILLTYPGSDMGNFEFRGWFHTSDAVIAVVRAIELTPGIDTSIHPKGVDAGGIYPFGVDAWANLDEIMYQTSWRAIPVDPLITGIFHQHPFFGEIVDQRTHLPIPIPMSLYMCNTRNSPEGSTEGFGGGTYTNVMRDKALPWIDPTIEHPLFGDHWYFSAVPIQGQSRDQDQGKGTEGLGQEQRYAVFVDDPLTHALFRDISTELTDEDRAELTRKYIGHTVEGTAKGTTKGTVEGTVEGDWPVVSTFFHEGGVPMWCIRDRNAFVRM